MLLERLYRNHVPANLTFVLVLVLGTLSYLQLPRQKDPTINFNWITIITVMPGASSEDMEKRVTEPLEDAVRKISDIRFVNSTSRLGVSNILVRFEQIDARTYDTRLNDLRREIQNKYNEELPDEAQAPLILEITSSNAFPSASIIVTGPGDDENLRVQARNIKKDLERLAGVDRVDDIGLFDPELLVEFEPEKLRGLGLSPSDLADTVRAYFRDVSAGTVPLADQQWLVRLLGTDRDPGYLARLPIVTGQGVVSLETVARVVRGTDKVDKTVRYEGRPAFLLAVMKKPDTNVLELLERIGAYIDTRNGFSHDTGATLVLLDDQTVSTRRAIGIMQNNALLGFAFVLLVTWAFLGSRIAFFTSIGIPFTLAGTFLVLSAMGMTLNNSVLLGVVIALGMLVDDAVVVVEAMYYRLRHGEPALGAAVAALREVFAPVTSSVLTTMAAFLPLMLLPGILGEFMKIVPLVVTMGLAISLLEAYWMLPTHVIAAGVQFERPSRIHRYRVAFTHWIQIRYGYLLVKVLRRPTTSLVAVVLLFAVALGAVAAGLVRLELFAFDPFRLFYINLVMPAGTSLERTIDKTLEVEEKIRALVRPGEVRAMASYAGQMFTETEPLFGEQYGQVMVSLNPKALGLREVDEMIAALRAEVTQVAGPVNVSVLRLSDGPPVTKPIQVKVRGDEYDEILAVVRHLQAFMREVPAITDISDDFVPGSMSLNLRLDGEAVKRAGLNPALVTRAVQALVDGEVVGSFQDQGEKVEVRVRADLGRLRDIQALLRHTLALPDGRSMPLGELVVDEATQGRGNIRHYDFRRAVTVEANLNKQLLDTVAANGLIQAEWERVRAEHPSVDLDFSGELDDIQESLGAIGVLFLLGVGLIYLILGAQFASYWQPLMILATVPMAATGVVLGLLLSGNPLSLFTLYGVVALVGIAVNSAIVLISAANDRRARGMSVLHATVYAARRRVIPILITSLTTIGGLFSLAAGLAGRSLLWGPVATAIVWGLGFSTVLTLLVIPLLYRMFMGLGGGGARPASPGAAG